MAVCIFCVLVFQPLLQLSRETQSAFLGITALVNHFCSMRNNCDQEPAVRGVMKNLEQHLGEKCTLHKSEGIGQVVFITLVGDLLQLKGQIQFNFFEEYSEFGEWGQRQKGGIKNTNIFYLNNSYMLSRSNLRRTSALLRL